MDKTFRDLCNETSKVLNNLKGDSNREQILKYMMYGICAGGNSSLALQLLENDNDDDRIKLLQNTFAINNYTSSQQRLNTYRAIITDLTDEDRQKFIADARGVIFDTKQMNNSGLCCDENGNAVEDSIFHVINNAQFKHWDVIEYVSNASGKPRLNAAAYANLSTSDKEDYVPMRYMYVVTANGERIQIDQNDYEWLSVLVAADIAKNFAMAERYACEVWRSDADNHGKAHAIRKAVIEALSKLQAIEYSGTRQLIKHLDTGTIQSWGQFAIAKMEALMTLTPAAFKKSSEDDIARYLDLANIFCLMDDDKRKSYIKQEDLDGYRGIKNEELKGVDENGKTVSPDKVTQIERKNYLRLLGRTLIKNIAESYGLDTIIRSSTPLMERLTMMYLSAKP